MKPERTLVAERALARHCPELLGAGQPPVEGRPAMAALAERLAPRLAARFTAFTPGREPDIELGSPRECNGKDLAADQAGLRACMAFAVAGVDRPFVVGCEAAGIFALVDRAFGGHGAAPDPLPAAFPLSADLLIGRIEKVLALALGETLGCAVTPRGREHAFLRLAPFAADEALVATDFSIADADIPAWRMTLAAPVGLWDALPGPGARSPAATPSRAFGDDPLAGPFGELPLSLQAVLVDMRMPVSVLAALVPGQVIPVSVARSVPLHVGAKVVAHGTIGASDDRVAVQINQVFAKDPT